MSQDDPPEVTPEQERPPPPTIRRWCPKFQLWVTGVFTLFMMIFTAGVFYLSGRLLDEAVTSKTGTEGDPVSSEAEALFSAIPDTGFWVGALLFYLLVFSLFYSPWQTPTFLRHWMNTLTKALTNIARGVDSRRSKPEMPRVPDPDPCPGHPIFEPVETGPQYKFPKRKSAPVQLLGVGVIVLAAIFCTYSGGPLRSPYGQVLFALPLLSPVVANSSASIAAAFGATVLAAGISTIYVESGERDAIERMTIVNIWPWISVTLVVLIISGALAYLNRRVREQEERSSA